MGNYLSRRSAEERLEARVAYLEAENARRSGFAESRLVVGFNVANCGENCGDAGDAPPPDRWWALTLARGGAGEVIRAGRCRRRRWRARAASHALVADPPVPGVALFGGEGAVGEANVPLRLDVARRRWTAPRRRPSTTSRAAAGSVGGRLYLCGGLFFGGDASPRFEAGVQVLEGAGPALGAPGAWAELAPMPSPASGATRRRSAGCSTSSAATSASGRPWAPCSRSTRRRGPGRGCPRAASRAPRPPAFGGELHVLAGDDDEDPDEEDNKATHHFIYDPRARRVAPGTRARATSRRGATTTASTRPRCSSPSTTASR
ncbi:monocarboxylate transporter [Aureococcus anophagefferens]|uniref:Monocarboxylate transporter n=1 Tax=Aureococcus anophagefferens TaxID=44056 RepID=A0ABR1GF43_AURAN